MKLPLLLENTSKVWMRSSKLRENLKRELFQIWMNIGFSSAFSIDITFKGNLPSISWGTSIYSVGNAAITIMTIFQVKFASPEIKRVTDHKTWTSVPYAFQTVCGFFNILQMRWDKAGSLSTLSKKTRKSNDLQMSLHFSSVILKTFSVGLIGVWRQQPSAP